MAASLMVAELLCGHWGPHVARLLQQGGVQCRVLDSWQLYKSEMVVKLLWSSIFWLLSAAHGGMQVGAIVQSQHLTAVEQLVHELLPIAEQYIHSSSEDCVIQAGSTVNSVSKRKTAQLPDPVDAHAQLQSQPQRLIKQQQQPQQQSLVGSTIPADTPIAVGKPKIVVVSAERQHLEHSDSSNGVSLLSDPQAVLQQLVGYSLAIDTAVPSVQMARIEFAWRNGFFLQQQATPVHVYWLMQAGCQDLVAQYINVCSG
eukprot:GHRR01019764.1.p1 GENE.GHRR01019764.1~~GHRR01019764.1.p1  ORF type:complete len:257 (+),score=103.73 GHRR01019764.1:252-1022(+)